MIYSSYSLHNNHRCLNPQCMFTLGEHFPSVASLQLFFATSGSKYNKVYLLKKECRTSVELPVEPSLCLLFVYIVLGGDAYNVRHGVQIQVKQSSGQRRRVSAEHWHFQMSQRLHRGHLVRCLES